MTERALCVVFAIRSSWDRVLDAAVSNMPSGFIAELRERASHLKSAVLVAVGHHDLDVVGVDRKVARACSRKRSRKRRAVARKSEMSVNIVAGIII